MAEKHACRRQNIQIQNGGTALYRIHREKMIFDVLVHTLKRSQSYTFKLKRQYITQI
jgi:hypothetical protein